MEQADFPLIVTQGVSFIMPFYYFNEDDLPIDLIGCTAQMQARQTVNAEDPAILDWSTTNGKIIIDEMSGSVLLSVSAADTALLEQVTNGVYDLLLTFSSGYVEKLIGGPINIVGRVTR